MELYPKDLAPEIDTPNCEFYGINDLDLHLVRYYKDKDKFRVFVNGFKLLFIHADDVIRHVYIDDTWIKGHVDERPLKAIVSYLLRGRERCLYVITSDIHLQYFHLQLTTQFGLDTRVDNVIINGDVFYKCLNLEKDNSSRVQITDVFIDYINTNLVPLLEDGRVVWINGNHDVKSAWSHSSLAHIPSKWKRQRSTTFIVNGKRFLVMHKWTDNVEGIYDYLILGHSCSYMLDDLIVKDYIQCNKYDIYVHNLYKYQYIPHDQFKDDGIYRFFNVRMTMKRTGNELSLRYNGEDTVIDIDDGPIYISPYRKLSEDFTAIEYGEDCLSFMAFDLIYISEMARINNNSTLICLNNIRGSNALFPNDPETDFPPFKSFGYSK